MHDIKKFVPKVNERFTLGDMANVYLSKLGTSFS